jgi:hypothetical protein
MEALGWETGTATCMEKFCWGSAVGCKRGGRGGKCTHTHTHTCTQTHTQKKTEKKREKEKGGESTT